jgi:hypothetical protein
MQFVIELAMVLLAVAIVLLDVALASGLAWIVGRVVKGFWRWMAALACGVAVPLSFALVAYHRIIHPGVCPSPCDGPGMALAGLVEVTVFVLLPLGIAASIASVIIRNSRERR